MTMTTCRLCGVISPAPIVSGKCPTCVRSLAAYEAIRDVAGLERRANALFHDIEEANLLLMTFIPTHRMGPMVEAIKALTEKRHDLLRRADLLMREHGLTEDDMNSYYGSEAEKAVAHHDPTPMLPAMSRVSR